MIPLSPFSFFPLLLGSDLFCFKQETIFYLIFSSNVWLTGHAAWLLQRWVALSQTYTRAYQPRSNTFMQTKETKNVWFKFHSCNSALWFSVKFIVYLITIEGVFANLISQECHLTSPSLMYFSWAEIWVINRRSMYCVMMWCSRECGIFLLGPFSKKEVTKQEVRRVHGNQHKE